MAYLIDAPEEPQANPFTPDFGKQPRSPVGHDNLLRILREGLALGPSDPRFTSLLLGPRGSGKTVMLQMVREITKSAGWIVLPLDGTTSNIEARINEMISWAHDSHADMPDEVVDKETVRTSSGIKLWSVGWQREAAMEIRRSWGVRRRLTTLAEHAAERHTAVVLAIDEMHSCERNELRRLAADIQHITKSQELPLALVAAGLSEMHHTLLEDKKMTFFQRCTRFDMPPLSPADAMRCLSVTARDAGGSFEGKALRMLTDASGTLPYRMQLLGHHAWRVAGAPRHPIDEQAAQLAIDETSRVMHKLVALPTWYSLNTAEQTVLRIVENHGGVATRQQIAQQAGLSPSTLIRAEQHLVNTGCVAVADEASIQIAGLMSVDDVRQITELEAQYNTSDIVDAVPTLGTASNRPRCAAVMPRAQARCILPKGHKGGHRSR